MSAIDVAVENSRGARPASRGKPAEPRLKLAVLTCMDARIDVFRLLGLAPGDAHVIRNAGGRVSQDVLQGLAVSQGALGSEEVMVIHHTLCAAMQPGEDLGEVLRTTVRLLRESDTLPRRDQVRGFIYDIEQERLDEVTV